MTKVSFSDLLLHRQRTTGGNEQHLLLRCHLHFSVFQRSKPIFFSTADEATCIFSTASVQIRRPATSSYPSTLTETNVSISSKNWQQASICFIKPIPLGFFSKQFFFNTAVNKKLFSDLIFFPAATSSCPIYLLQLWRQRALV